MDELNSQLRELKLVVEGKSQSKNSCNKQHYFDGQKPKKGKCTSSIKQIRKEDCPKICSCRCHLVENGRRRPCHCHRVHSDDWPLYQSQSDNHNGNIPLPYTVPIRCQPTISERIGQRNSVKSFLASHSSSNSMYMSILPKENIIDAFKRCVLDIEPSDLILSLNLESINFGKHLTNRNGTGCAIEAFKTEPGPSVVELAAYLEDFLHIPRKMSGMAESMYA